MTSRDERRLLEMGGIGYDGAIGEGQIDPAAGWRLWAGFERAEVVADRVEWQWREETPKDIPWRRSATGLLDSFISLSDGNPTAVRDFVREWGPLGLCAEHDRLVRDCSCKKAWVVAAAEPLDLWYDVAAEARGLLIAAALGKQRLPVVGVPPALAAALTRPWHVSDPQWMRAAGIRHRDDLLAALPGLAREDDGSFVWGVQDMVNMWLVEADIRPRLSWLDPDWEAGSERSPVADRPYLTFGVNSLFAALTLQLVLAVADAGRLAICASCQRPYFPRRKPPRGRRSYCSQCGLRAAWRDAKRRQRA